MTPPADVVCAPLGRFVRQISTKDTTVYLNNASKVLQMRVDCTSPQRNEQLVRVARRLCPLFDKTHHCTVKTLSGGLSNALFIVSNTNINKSVLVRVHPCTDRLVDRNEENKILAWLSRQHKAPTFYGRFLNGRVEEYYDGYQPLSCHDMATHATLIATKMADLHSLQVPDHVFKQGTTSTTTNNNIGQIWNRVEGWFQLLEPENNEFCQTKKETETDTSPLPTRAASFSSSSDDEEEEEDSNDGVLSVEYMHREWQWLRQQLSLQTQDSTTNDETPTDEDATAFARQTVFAHMDAQSLNLLTNQHDNEDLKVIDFEYAGMHPRAADIANTFCEYCDMNNLQGQWDTEFPSQAQQDQFLKAYLERCGVANKDEAWHAQFRDQVAKHTLVSHLGWAVWSLVQQQGSEIDFDYLKYAKHRMDGYEYFKRKFWSDDIV